jgi:hypothetical protein
MVRICAATLSLLILFCIVSTTGMARDSTDFRLQDYIPERISDFRWKVDGTIGLGRDAGEDPPDYPQGTEVSGEQRGADFNLRLINYWGYAYQTRQGLFECDWSLDTYVDDRSRTATSSSADTHNNRSESTSESSSRFSRVDFSVRGQLRRYLTRDLHLAAIGDGRYSYRYSKSDAEQSDRYMIHYFDPEFFKTSEGGAIFWSSHIDRRIDFTGDVLIGWGRRYDGKHAVTAIQLVEELDRVGLAKRRPDRRELLWLSELVHQLREGHGPDRREYRIEALESIVGYLVERGVVEESNAAAILTIEDVWDYFPSGERRFGWEFQIGYGGTHEYYNVQSESSRLVWSTKIWDYPDTSSTADSIAFQRIKTRDSDGRRLWYVTHYYGLRGGWWRPLSARWQFDATAWFRMYFDQDERYDLHVRMVNKRTTDASIALTYFHDARTELKFEAAFDYERLSRREDNRDEQVRIWGIDATARVEYRLAVPTTMVVSWTYYRNSFWSTAHDYHDPEALRHGFNLSVGLTHWLF